MNKYYYIIIIVSNDTILCNRKGIIICNNKAELITKVKSIYENCLRSTSRQSEVPIKNISESIRTFNFGDDLYELKFELININYINKLNIQSKYHDVVTEKYRVWVAYDGNVFLDKYLVFDDGEELRFEDSDIDTDSGIKFNVGDHVRFIKDPFKSTFVVKGKVGPDRHIDDCDCCNYYSIEKDDGTIYFDDAHESELIKI